MTACIHVPKFWLQKVVKVDLTSAAGDAYTFYVCARCGVLFVDWGVLAEK